jgi:phospholipase C
VLAGEIVTRFIWVIALVAAVTIGSANAVNAAGIESIENIVVIYAENRSFDNLYGFFPVQTACPG